MTSRKVRPPRLVALLGPAFVASVAYVDPGNVAANLTAGSRYGYALVWVLVVASLMAMVIQYQSAKLGLVTGRTLPQVMQDRLADKPWRGPVGLAYSLQAFVMSVATDIAEVVGGALALWLLFGTPLWLGGIIVGVVAVALLAVLRLRGEKTFEVAVAGVLLIIALGFLGSLSWVPVDWPATLAGVRPSVPDSDAWPLIAAMLGATVMPHAIYLHSALAIDRHQPRADERHRLPHLLRAQKLDVGLALLASGSVNVGMLLLAAAGLQGLEGDAIQVAHHQLRTDLGWWPSVVFGVGLLASGVGSAVVGTHAGAQILKDLTRFRHSPMLRRLLTIGPAVLLLTLGIPPTAVLVWSQVVLSFGIALAAAPLARFTADRRLMHEHTDAPWLVVVNGVIVTTLIGLNLVVLWWVLTGA